MSKSKQEHPATTALAIMRTIQKTRKEIDGLEQVLRIKQVRLELAEKAYNRIVKTSVTRR